jgi:2-phospho-L-lactate guanylyltransferase
MKWTAIIPYREGGGKSRLSKLLSPGERLQLSRNMFGHVSKVLAACSDVEDVLLLGDDVPEIWTGSFEQDGGSGLNGELAALVKRRSGGPTLIIHADLPLLESTDVVHLLALAAASGCALAPDRAVTGTNALALADPLGFAFHFGPGSFALHRASAGNGAGIAKRPGLAIDIDTPEDYLEACRAAPKIMQRMRGAASVSPT